MTKPTRFYHRICDTKAVESLMNCKLQPERPEMSEQAEKTPLEVKQEKFAKEPEKFFHEDDIVMAVLRSKEGLMTCHGACTRMEMEQALTRITYKTIMVFQHMDMTNAMKAKESEIITSPNGGNGKHRKPFFKG